MVNIRNDAELLKYLKDFKQYIEQDQITSNYSITYLKQMNEDLNDLIWPLDEELADKHKEEFINLNSYGQILILYKYMDIVINNLEAGQYE